MPEKFDPTELPNAELEVLAYLWQQESATARDVRDGLANLRPMTDGATVTLLKRLEAKGLVKRHKPPQKQFIYKPTRKPQPAYRQLVSKMTDRVFGGDGAQLVVSLLESRPPSEADLDRIEKALAAIKKNRK